MGLLWKLALFVLYAVAVGIVILICLHLLIRFRDLLGWFQVHADGKDRQNESRKKPKGHVRKDSDAA